MTTLFFEKSLQICKRKLATKYEASELMNLNLPIRIHYAVLPRTILGSETLYSYWKTGLWLDLVSRTVVVYIPPERRILARGILRQWIGKVRKHAFENITLGGTHYHWIGNVLMPEEQDPAFIPIAGVDGWLESPGYIHVWNDKLPRGNKFHISVNRRPLPDRFDLQKLTHYWRITVHPENKELITIWVPPEWRRLSDSMLYSWVHKAVVKENLNPINLGGIKYRWEKFTIAPEEQRFELIQYDTKPLTNPWVIEPTPCYQNGSNTLANVKSSQVPQSALTSTPKINPASASFEGSNFNNTQSTDRFEETWKDGVLNLPKYHREPLLKNIVTDSEFEDVLGTIDTVSLTKINATIAPNEDIKPVRHSPLPDLTNREQSNHEETKEPLNLSASSFDIPFKYFKEYYNL